MMDDNNNVLLNELTKLLLGGSAHAGLQDALQGLPANLRGIKPDKLPYSIWQLVEHIRIAQWDMLQFCKDENHISPKWPDDYWPKEPASADNATWEESLEQINNDRDEFIALLEHSDLYQMVPGGAGQTFLLEALQMADHNAYHVAEIIVIRRLLGAWKS